MWIFLKPPKVERVIKVGKERQAEAIRMGLEDKHGFEGDGEAIHINGAGGECAFAEAMGVEWAGHVNTFKKGGDVLHYQIRTRSRHWYDLIVREDDDPEAIFVHVTGELPEYFVAGWIRGRDARLGEWRRAYAGREEAWFVPKNGLFSLSILTGYTPKVIERKVPKPPDLQEWVARYGGYWKIDWVAWDEAIAQWREAMRHV